MQLIITNEDYREALGNQQANGLIPSDKEVAVLGPERTNRVLDALPKVLASRFGRMIPDDYEIHQIELKVSLSGTPFGVGVSGDATIKFGPPASHS